MKPADTAPAWATEVIALLTEIRDELARPRLEVERLNAESRANILEQEDARRAAAGLAALERAATPLLWAPGAQGGKVIARPRDGSPAPPDASEPQP